MDETRRLAKSKSRLKLSWKLFLPTLVLLLGCAGGTLLAVEGVSLSDWLRSSRRAALEKDDLAAELRAEEAEQVAQAGLDGLLAAEHSQTDPAELAKMAESLIQAHAKSSVAGELRRRRDGYYRRAEEREIELARAASATLMIFAASATTTRAPGDVSRSFRRYLAYQAKLLTAFIDPTRRPLRLAERVSRPGEYRVTLQKAKSSVIWRAGSAAGPMFQ